MMCIKPCHALCTVSLLLDAQRRSTPAICSFGGPTAARPRRACSRHGAASTPWPCISTPVRWQRQKRWPRRCSAFGKRRACLTLASQRSTAACACAYTFASASCSDWLYVVWASAASADSAPYVLVASVNAADAVDVVANASAVSRCACSYRFCDSNAVMTDAFARSCAAVASSSAFSRSLRVRAVFAVSVA